MNNTIYRYQLQVSIINTIMLPKDAEILHVDVKKNMPCIWALVDKKETEAEPRLFYTYGTGHEIKDRNNLKYLGTYKIQNDDLIFHVFEVIR